MELIAELPQSIATVLPISVAHDLVYNVPSQSTAFETNLCKKKKPSAVLTPQNMGRTAVALQANAAEQ